MLSIVYKQVWTLVTDLTRIDTDYNSLCWGYGIVSESSHVVKTSSNFSCVFWVTVLPKAKDKTAQLVQVVMRGESAAQCGQYYTRGDNVFFFGAMSRKVGNDACGKITKRVGYWSVDAFICNPQFTLMKGEVTPRPVRYVTQGEEEFWQRMNMDIDPLTKMVKPIDEP